MTYETPIQFASPSGATLSLRHQLAGTGGRAVILISHGLVEHSGRYGAFAGFLAGRGYHVYAHDHRGHGRSTAPDAPFGRFARQDGGRRVVEDLNAVRDFAAGRHPGLPVIVFGHSLGGNVALAAAEARPDAFDGLAVWNANANPGIPGQALVLILRLERLLKGSDVPSFYGMRLTFDTWAKSPPDAHSAFDWLSREARQVKAYIEDPLCGFQPSVSMWLDVMQLTDEAGRVSALGRLPKTLPVHLVGGGKDPVTRGGETMRWLARRLTSLGIDATDLTIYEDMRHETLNEIGREEAMKAFAAWADGVVTKVSQNRANG
jgi:alpha-beta hydrolase superfamily lysophospholipase